MPTTVLSFFLLLLLPLLTSAQRKPTQAELDAVLNDGIELWQLDLATSYSSGFLFEQLSQEGLSGYFSYRTGDTIRTIFYEGGFRREKIKYTFTYSIPVKSQFLSLDGTPRKMTPLEAKLLKVRNRVIRHTRRKDKVFNDGKGTKLNLTTLQRDGGFVAYLVPATGEDGKIPLGHDFRFYYSEKGKLRLMERLHQNAIPMETGTGAYKPGPGVATMHVHAEESPPLITPTDISQLMMYREYCSWTDHYVVGPDFVSYFNTETQELLLMTRKEFNQISRKP